MPKSNWELRNEFMVLLEKEEGYDDLVVIGAAMGWDKCYDTALNEIEALQTKLGLAYETLNEQHAMLEQAAEQMAAIIREVQGDSN